MSRPLQFFPLLFSPKPPASKLLLIRRLKRFIREQLPVNSELMLHALTGGEGRLILQL